MIEKLWLQRYYFRDVGEFDWPPEVLRYNEQFVKRIEAIKRRHDPVVTTVGK